MYQKSSDSGNVCLEKSCISDRCEQRAQTHTKNARGCGMSHQPILRPQDFEANTAKDEATTDKSTHDNGVRHNGWLHHRITIKISVIFAVIEHIDEFRLACLSCTRP